MLLSPICKFRHLYILILSQCHIDLCYKTTQTSVHVHAQIYAGSHEGLSSRKLCVSHLWEGVLAYIKSVCVYVRLCACVYVYVYVQASQPAFWYFIGINNRCVCLWQFTQSVSLSHRQTPYCYCLAQRLTQRAAQNRNDISTEMTL